MCFVPRVALWLPENHCHPKQPRDLVPGSPTPGPVLVFSAFRPHQSTFQAPLEYLFPLPGLATALLLVEHPLRRRLPASQPVRQPQLSALPGCSLSSRPFSCTPVSTPSGFDGFKISVDLLPSPSVISDISKQP